MSRFLGTQPDIIWSKPCAEMLKEVVRLMNAQNPRALLGLSPVEQEDVNRYMQWAWESCREVKLLPEGSIGLKWPPIEAMLNEWPRTHRVKWIEEVVDIQFLRDQAIKRSEQQSTDILFDPSTNAPPFVKPSGRQHPDTRRFTVADCLAGFQHFHNVPRGFAEQEGGGFVVHTPARASSTRSSPVSSPATASPPQLTSRIANYWGEMPADMSNYRQARIERPASSHDAHHPSPERPPPSARHGEQHNNEPFPASRQRSHGTHESSAWERIGRRLNRVGKQGPPRGDSQTTHQLYHTNTLPVPPSHGLHHAPSNPEFQSRAQTVPVHNTAHQHQQGPPPPHPAHIPQRRQTRLPKRVLRKASGWFGGSRQ